MGPHNAPARPARGPLLTVLLVLVTGGSLFGIASTILFFSALPRMAALQIDPAQNLAHAKKILTVMLVASCVRLVCAGGMWMWKQWGVFGYVGMAMLETFLESRLYPHHRYSYGHLVWVVLVLVAALPKWSQFEA